MKIKLKKKLERTAVLDIFHLKLSSVLIFLEQNLATTVYLFGLGALLTGLWLKYMRIRSHHDLAGALVTSLLLGRPWWSTTSPTCLSLSVFTITSDQHQWPLGQFPNS